VAYWSLGQLDEAEQSAHQALKTQRAMGDGVAIALATELCSWIAHDCGQFSRATDLSMAAGFVWRSLGTSLVAFGPQLSGFAAEHTTPSIDTSHADHRRATQRFDDRDEVIDFVLRAKWSRGRVRQEGSASLTKWVARRAS
jgi:hypothetical protein